MYKKIRAAQLLPFRWFCVHQGIAAKTDRKFPSGIVAAVAAGTVGKIIISGHRLFYLDLFVNPVCMRRRLLGIVIIHACTPWIDIVIWHVIPVFLYNIIP